MDQKTDSLKQFSAGRTKPTLEGNEDDGEVPDLVGHFLCKYKGLWFPVQCFRPIIRARNNFKANDSDIILATIPKSGTTWLKALTFTIANRDKFPISETPLLTLNPHELVQFLEYDIYSEHEDPNLSHIPSPRIFSTHISYSLLPTSIHGHKSKVIYICRNPLDQFVSYWNFLLQNKSEVGFDLPMEEVFELFCIGRHPFGPFWDHMLGYWNASLENPHKILFLKYEDLKEDIVSNIKKIAEFMGYPFSQDEEKQDQIGKVASMCSFESLKNVAERSSGPNVVNNSFQRTSFYRKGEVGDWVNHLTPRMAERLKNLVEDKFGNSGLVLKCYN